ncbi:hypothetical protein KKH18_07975 [bacterium]|nr:hypothetical protein [bacterium]
MILNKLTFSLFIMAAICDLSAAFGAEPENSKAVFLTPQRGSIIQNRRQFPAAVQLSEFKSESNYWIAIASVTGHDSTWDEIVTIHNRMLENDTNVPPAGLVELMKEWKPNLFWPKFAVPESPYESLVFDGGNNPLQGLEPQPMILLALDVDDSLHEFFKAWFRQGTEGKGYQGIPVSRLGKDMILGRCEIIFP